MDAIIAFYTAHKDALDALAGLLLAVIVIKYPQVASVLATVEKIAGGARGTSGLGTEIIPNAQSKIAEKTRLTLDQATKVVKLDPATGKVTVDKSAAVAAVVGSGDFKKLLRKAGKWFKKKI